MQYRRQSPYPRPQSSFAYARSNAQNKASHRCKLLVAVLVFLLFGVLFRNRESKFRPMPPLPPNAHQLSIMEKADRLYQKYIAASRAAKAQNGGDEAEEETELFNILLEEEQHHVEVEEESSSAVAIERMMQEGVVEDPNVDHQEKPVEVVEQSVVEEEHAIVVVEDDEVATLNGNVTSPPEIVTMQKKASEQVQEPVSTEVHEDNEEDDDEEEEEDQGFNSSTLFKQNHISGYLNYKMVNNHFLAWIDALKYAGWTRVHYDSSANLFLTKPVTPVMGSRGKMISQISKSSCIGGTKGGQLSCRSKFAAKHGCEFDTLGISPKQFDMWRSEDCNRFFDYALPLQDKQWIGKVGASYHGRKITIYTGVTKHIRATYGKCRTNQITGGGYIMMEYISKPALLDGRKFDMRTFLLVADTKPFLVFYHNGFVRRSANAYSTNLKDKLAHITNVEEQGTSADHFLGFADLQTELTKQLNFPSDFLQNVFEPRAKLVTNYVFQAARASGLKRRTGAFGLFGLDWMIDMDYNIHLLEGNGNPVVQHYPGTGDLTPKLWRDMASLLTRLHMEEKKLPLLGPLKRGFRFENEWELIFSELEELASGKEYNPCNAGL